MAQDTVLHKRIPADTEAVRLVQRGTFPRGIKKYLLSAGELRFECVVRQNVSEPGCTISFSSQVGCPVGCPFCATGLQGLTRNLTAHEIASQVEIISTDCGAAPAVLEASAQGEPLLNLDALLDALDLTAASFPQARRVVSTCGVVGSMERVIQNGHQLRITLHSGFQSVRDILMPGAMRWGVEELAACVRAINSQATEQPNRKVEIVWGLLRGVNDSVLDAWRLTELLEGCPCEVLVESMDASPDKPWVARACSAAAQARANYATTCLASGRLAANDHAGQDIYSPLNKDEFARTLAELGVMTRVLPADPTTPLSMKYYRR